MKVQHVLTRRGRSLIAATGIAAVVMLNGLGGGIAGANQAPPVVCETAPASQSQSGMATDSAAGGSATASYPDNQGVTTTVPGVQTVPDSGGRPAESGAATGSTAGGSGVVTSDGQTAPGQMLETAQSCALQGNTTTGQTVSVEVCVSSNDNGVTHIAPTTGVLPDQSGTTEKQESAAANSSVVSLNPATETKPGEPGSSVAEASISGAVTEGMPANSDVVTTFEDGSGATVVESGVPSAGASTSSSSTCVSVTVTDGVPSITGQATESGVATHGGFPNSNNPNAGQPATGDAVPTQPGTTTSPQVDPYATPPATGQ